MPGRSAEEVFAVVNRAAQLAGDFRNVSRCALRRLRATRFAELLPLAAELRWAISRLFLSSLADAERIRILAAREAVDAAEAECRSLVLSESNEEEP